MCFTQEMSAAFSAVGLLAALWAYQRGISKYVIAAMLYFVLMEVLQAVQYFFIAYDIDPVNPTLEQMLASPACQSTSNKFLTFLGYVHIAFQPCFNTYVSGHARNAYDKQYQLVLRFQVIGALLFISRYLLTLVDFAAIGLDPVYNFNPDTWEKNAEWLNGPALCTYKGLYHLAWSVPLVPVSYYMCSISLHFILMFVPDFAIDDGCRMENWFRYIRTMGTMITGPLLADYITSNKHEAASIWCFFSVTQVVSFILYFMVFENVKTRVNKIGSKLA